MSTAIAVAVIAIVVVVRALVDRDVDDAQPFAAIGGRHRPAGLRRIRGAGRRRIVDVDVVVRVLPSRGGGGATGDRRPAKRRVRRRRRPAAAAAAMGLQLHGAAIDVVVAHARDRRDESTNDLPPPRRRRRRRHPSPLPTERAVVSWTAAGTTAPVVSDPGPHTTTKYIVAGIGQGGKETSTPPPAVARGGGGAGGLGAQDDSGGEEPIAGAFGIQSPVGEAIIAAERPGVPLSLLSLLLWGGR